MEENGKSLKPKHNHHRMYSSLFPWIFMHSANATFNIEKQVLKSLFHELLIEQTNLKSVVVWQLKGFSTGEEKVGGTSAKRLAGALPCCATPIHASPFGALEG